jgi:hypothetical protein
MNIVDRIVYKQNNPRYEVQVELDSFLEKVVPEIENAIAIRDWNHALEVINRISRTMSNYQQSISTADIDIDLTFRPRARGVNITPDTITEIGRVNPFGR